MIGRICICIFLILCLAFSVTNIFISDLKLDIDRLFLILKREKSNINQKSISGIQIISKETKKYKNYKRKKYIIEMKNQDQKNDFIKRILSKYTVFKLVERKIKSANKNIVTMVSFDIFDDDKKI